MAEYISREELRKHLKECYDNELFDADMRKATIGIDVYVENMPAADVQPVKHGRWELTNNPSFRKCSVCGAWWSSDITDNCFTNYCPKCGARMDIIYENDQLEAEAKTIDEISLL